MCAAGDTVSKQDSDDELRPVLRSRVMGCERRLAQYSSQQPIFCASITKSQLSLLVGDVRATRQQSAQSKQKHASSSRLRVPGTLPVCPFLGFVLFKSCKLTAAGRGHEWMEKIQHVDLDIRIATHL